MSVKKEQSMTVEGTHNLWGDLHRPDLSPSETDFSMIGIPFDGLASARKGAAFAPERLHAWSRHLTPFSEDRTRLKDLTICDLGDIITDPEADFDLVRQRVAALEGRGMGSLLVKTGLTYARENKLSVQSLCWFVDGYLRRHEADQNK